MELKGVEKGDTIATAWIKPNKEGDEFRATYLGSEVGGSLLAATVTLDEARRIEGGEFFEVIKSSIQPDFAAQNSYRVEGSRNFSLYGDPQEPPILNGVRAFREVSTDPVVGESA